METNTIHKNILVIITGLLVLFFVFKSDYFLYAALITGILSLLSFWIAKNINMLWMKLALALGWVNSKILLSVVFYLFLFPMAVITRMFKKNLLNLDNTSESLFEKRNHTYTKEDLENVW